MLNAIEIFKMRRLSMLLALTAVVACGNGSVKSRCKGAACLGADEGVLTCAPTPAPSPFAAHTVVEPPNPIACRPPNDNPGGVNGTRGDRILVRMNK
jgi:hypothetical protein